MVDIIAKTKMVMVVIAAKAVLPVNLTGTMVVATVVVASVMVVVVSMALSGINLMMI